MTQPVWPFSLVHPPSYPSLGVPTPAEINLLQNQVAVAADGRLWTDVAVLRNSRYKDVSTFFDASRFDLVLRDPVSRRWLIFGAFGGPIVEYWSVIGEVWNYTGAIAAATLNGVPKGSANAAGTILVGAAPISASTQKLVLSTDGGNTWAIRNIGTANTQSVQAIAYSETLGLWICSLGDNTHDGIYSSPDANTWTLRAANINPSFLTVADLPTPIILGSVLVGIGGAGYRRSVDGITWTSETLPENVSSQQPCWSDALGAFFMSGATGIWKSSTGLTSSWTKVYAGTEQASLGVLGRMLVRGDGKYSLDGAVSWSAFCDINAQSDWAVASSPAGVMVFRRASREYYMSRQVGF